MSAMLAVLSFTKWKNKNARPVAIRSMVRVYRMLRRVFFIEIEFTFLIFFCSGVSVINSILIVYHQYGREGSIFFCAWLTGKDIYCSKDVCLRLCL